MDTCTGRVFALVHVQFESIHSYLDGTGRRGRMLIALQLA